MATGSIVRKYGNTTYYFVTQKDTTGDTFINQQITKEESDRIKNTTYVVGGENISGSEFLSTLGEKNYVGIGRYQSETGDYNPLFSDPQYNSVNNFIQNDTDLKKLVVGPPNTSNPNQPSPDGGSSTPTSEPNQSKSLPFAVLTYPTDMDPKQDRIKFQAVRVTSRTGGGGSGLNFNFGEPIYETVGAGPVVMAIQAPISDQNSVDWGPDSINAFQSALYYESMNLMKIPEKQLGPEIQGFANKIMGEFRSRGEIFKKYIAGQAAGVNNILARTDIVILNPNLELLFQGPQLRPFSFTFKMSARNKPESIEIRKIIRYFKENMSVRKEQGLFLKAPHVFTIQYFQGNDKKHKSINRISSSDITKACALTNCSVDYTPLGSYMTFSDEDATMVSYTLSLQFQEITPVYDTDYKDLLPDEIGY
jgi:hypothetical protein